MCLALVGEVDLWGVLYGESTLEFVKQTYPMFNIMYIYIYVKNIKYLL